MPQFETTFYLNQIIWILISFSILYLIIYSFVFPMLSDIIRDRNHQIEEYLAQAEHFNTLAQKNEKAYTQALLEAEEQASQIALKTQEKITALKKRNASFIQKTTRHAFENAEQQLAKERALILQKKAHPLRQSAENLATRLVKES